MHMTMHAALNMQVTNLFLVFPIVVAVTTAAINYNIDTPAPITGQFIAAISTEMISSTSSNNIVDTSVINTTLFALLAFKQATADPTSFLALWNTSISPDYCNWRGVRCSDGTHNVIALLLDSNQLSGTLPPQLKELSHLSYLSVSNNSFHGSIPPEWGELSSLTHLDLSFNELTGSIPPSLANCTLLEYMDLSTNSLSSKTFPPFLTSLTHLVYLDLSVNTFPGGELPPDIGRLSSLQFLQLYSCNLTGSLSPSITNCTSLVLLNLVSNALMGPLPSDWSRLASSLQQIYLHYNWFTGSIPSSLGNCTALTGLGLGNNSLTGGLPESLGKLAMLQYLAVFDNSISGPIPTSIVNCSVLTNLQLGHNNLTGRIPADIGQLKQVERLVFVSNTKLSGVIPDSIGECAKLQLVIFRSTGVGGPLPMSIYNLSSLHILRLSLARFSGSLSEHIKNMTALTTLELDGNTFHGRIPAGLGELRELQGLSLQHNSFEGPIPWLWHAMSISQIDFSYNFLTGDIPAALGRLPLLNDLSLQHNRLSGDIPAVLPSAALNLDLSHNMLTGQIPPSLSVTETLDLSFNRLTGVIPPSMGSMQMVSAIRLAGNNLTGGIPNTLAGCYGLQSLDLSVNNLDGEIPSTLGQLRVLEYMNLSHNNLSGALPPSLGALQYLVSLNVSYNALQGMIPRFKNYSAVDFRGNPGLCGYPLMSTTRCIISPHSSHSARRQRRTIVIVSVCSIGGGILMLLVCICSWWRWRSLSSARRKILSNDELIDGEAWVGMQKSQLRAWTSRELRAATNEFNTTNVLGSGGSSVCFKGVVVAGRASVCTLVAIKRLNCTGFKNGREARRSFVQELKTLCQVRHRNLVKTLGYCQDEGEMALVMEFMENGNLDEHLHSEAKSLGWDERLSIAMDVAEGLVYLHHECIQPIIHCDLKPGNILLGSDMVAKISDFGIARLLDRTQTEDLLSTSNFRGTFGYAAPECAAGSHISTQVDVYSYGVILIELMTGMKPTNPQLQGSGITLRTWIQGLRKSCRNNVAEGILDTAVQEALRRDPALFQQLEELLDLGAKCTNDSPRERPNIKDVRETLIKFAEPRLSSLYSHRNSSYKKLVDKSG